MTWIFSVIGSYWHCTYGCRMNFCCPWGCGSTRPHSYTPLTWGRWCSYWQGRDNRVCSLAAIYRSQVYILKKRKECFNCMVKWTLGEHRHDKKFNSLFVMSRKIIKSIKHIFTILAFVISTRTCILFDFKSCSIKPLDSMSLWFAHNSIHG